MVLGRLRQKNIAFCSVRARERDYGFGLVSLHIKGVLLARPFVISNNWLAPEEQSLLNQKKVLRYQNIIILKL